LFVSEFVPVHDSIAAGWAALSGGRWLEARSRFQQALARVAAPEALEGMSWADWWLEDVSGCLDARERAYRMYRQAGDARGAARMALWLGDAYIEFRGAQAVADGWFRRAAGILEDLGPTPEHGWLAAFEANAALDQHDGAAARRLAEQARGLGRRYPPRLRDSRGRLLRDQVRPRGEGTGTARRGRPVDGAAR
jgi:hypothetical protein